MALVLPALDLRGGRCVRLRQGDYAEETVYFDDPVKMARLWRVQNACALHVVDLDAARGGLGGEGEDNRDAIGAICEALDVPVQLGGGIRSLEAIEAALEMGVYRVVIGTAAVREPALVSEAIERFGCRRVVVSIDAEDGEARVDGWTEGGGTGVAELALDMEERGVRRFVYTDIRRDGTMEGPNVEAYRTLGQRLHKAKITASGGVGGYDDLLRIQELAPYGVDSVIVGRALYENAFPCQQFWAWNDLDSVDLDRFSTAQLKDEALPSDC
ncbi:MAG: 1-(5-phosphoribosyl)-5-[(5-phosphoribosylamino)methylideneamino]imidazole-4-carboxamide isomerase [Bacteroidetes bacterium QS_9_68_14]|nr:MAG: 1-(5-phosphoribosyl)-5-[(5-phosphoribosylamino)methylideneamino]imidazole-4-carboxamide isomerase [Bacteroidetes bacterium QS_9_68_14]